jgi:predicted ArsR family transcriptional regulator
VPDPLSAENAQQQLTQALAAVIGEDDDGGRARSVRAGERWSTQFAAGDVPAGPVADVLPPLLRVLAEIGFEPEHRTGEAMIALPACPFRAEARQNPDVVCSVHLGLLKGVARSLGHDSGRAHPDRRCPGRLSRRKPRFRRRRPTRRPAR